MTIYNPTAYMDGVWDWGFLDSCFTHGIKVSDIDGIVERNACFLSLETKSISLLNEPLSIGQARTFKALVQHKGFVILIIWGERQKPEYSQLWTPTGIRPKQATDLEYIWNLVSRWFKWADSQERPIVPPIASEMCVVCKRPVDEWADPPVGIFLDNGAVHWGNCMYIHQYQCVTKKPLSTAA